MSDIVQRRGSAARRLVGACAVAGVLLAAAPAASQARFVVVAPPAGLDESYGLTSVAAVSRSDAWAAGTIFPSPGAGVLHWNGSRWRRSLPDVGVSALAASGAGDVWSVGAPYADTTIYHYDGRRWTAVGDVPRAPSRVSYSLTAARALAPGDAWAVGFRWDSTTADQATLAEHWDGERWRVVPTPDPAASASGGLVIDAFNAVGGGRRNLWAVGYRYDNAGQAALAERWDGDRWRVSPTGRLRGVDELRGVRVLSRRNVWAVGVGNAREGVIAHWNGRRWRLVPAARSGCRGTVALNAVSSTTRRDVWAFGECQTAFGDHGIEVRGFTVAERWDGRRWRLVKTPDPAHRQGDIQLRAAARIPGTSRFWAVGEAGGNEATLGRPIILRGR